MREPRLLVERKQDALEQGLIQFGEQIAHALQSSIDALRNQDAALACDVVAGDRLVNQERRILEQQALVTLAAYQPAGRSLRAIGASMEMIAELERIADHAADVARIIHRQGCRAFPDTLRERVLEMGELAGTIFREVMKAYASDDEGPGVRAAIAAEDRVDALEQAAIREVTEWLCGHGSEPAQGVDLLWIAHHYERVADRCTNLAERVIYIATGETVELD